LKVVLRQYNIQCCDVSEVQETPSFLRYGVSQKTAMLKLLGFHTSQMAPGNTPGSKFAVEVSQRRTVPHFLNFPTKPYFGSCPVAVQAMENIGRISAVYRRTLVGLVQEKVPDEVVGARGRGDSVAARSRSI
jgi:hypothetical protein